jgi:hypothetical protein
MSTPGRPKCEYRSAAHEGPAVSTLGRPKCHTVTQRVEVS